MEPSEGRYDLDWLEHAITAAAKHNIYTLLGTAHDLTRGFKRKNLNKEAARLSVRLLNTGRTLLTPMEAKFQSIQESNSRMSTGVADSVPRGMDGPIARASAWFSNHTRNEDCSAPGRRCRLSQL